MSKLQNDKLKIIDDFKSTYNFQWNFVDELDDSSYNNDMKEIRDRWIESLQKDIYVNEAMNLLKDLSNLNSNQILSQLNID